MMGKIEITLKSDLCAASGDGFSSVIDTDVSYDKLGFPVIGGRRIKGCLKDAAEIIGSKMIDEIFGVSGCSKSGALKVSDAYIENYASLKAEAENIKSGPDEILSIFTYTKASTAIEDDTAKDNSLRFTRVVKHFSPVDENEMKFYADVDIDEKYEEEFSDICKALRNIGYKRNRGFGAIECKYIKDNKKEPKYTEFNISDESCEYTYIVRLKENVMLPGKVSDETMDYIPGTSVLGFLAGKYIEKYGECKEFDEIFLKNNVRFSNLYISDKSGNEYCPAPVVLGKIKGEKGCFNILKFSPKEEKIIKPVKSGYCGSDIVIIKPLTETVYHHSAKDDIETGSKKTLYTQTSLCKDQYFRGTITGKTEYVKKVVELLETSVLRFGRSKSAQYSDCEIVHKHAAALNRKKADIKIGNVFFVLLLSDVLIPDESGGYDISVEGLKKAIGLEKLECDNGLKRKCSALRYRVVSGYNTKWNIQKPHIRTIAAGSTLVFTAEDNNMDLPERTTIGAKQNEGFGQVLICKADDFSKALEKNTNENACESELSGILSKIIEENKQIEEMREKAINFAKNIGTINSSQIGRYILMVKNAASFNELETWKGKIRSEQSRKFFDKIIEDSKAVNYSESDDWKNYLELILTLIKYSNRREK